MYCKILQHRKLKVAASTSFTTLGNRNGNWLQQQDTACDGREHLAGSWSTRDHSQIIHHKWPIKENWWNTFFPLHALQISHSHFCSCSLHEQTITYKRRKFIAIEESILKDCNSDVKYFKKWKWDLTMGSFVKHAQRWQCLPYLYFATCTI